MAELGSVLQAVLPALLGGALASVLVERLLTPAPSWSRPTASWLLHVGFWLLGFAAELCLFQRPGFAAAFVLAFLLFVVLVSNAKFSSLREPFIFSDFEYFSDALRHPRLYIPFLGWWRAALALAGFIAAVAIGLEFEAPLSAQFGWAALLQAIGLIVALALVCLASGAVLQDAVGFDPLADLQRIGLVASLWAYAMAERRPIDRVALSRTFPAPAAAAARPHLLVVQSESFFDARRLDAGIDRAVLANWDRLQQDAVQHGRLKVAAWGANTVRTEFSFLSGLDSEHLGVHRFNPYRRLARAAGRERIATLATHLRAQGYRTVCVHPYPASFYARNKVFPDLGFDEFIDIKAFSAADRDGPFTADAAVAARINALIDSSRQPLFVFAITMENHGPLHLEKPGADAAAWFAGGVPAGCADLAVYLRHLANADRMVATLRARLETLDVPAWLCVYGDHVPIMAEVYARLGEPDGDTDYAIWGNRAPAPTSPVATQDLAIAELAVTLLQHAQGTPG